MTATIKIYGIPEALRAFDELPRRVRFKHLRIALSAGGGVVRDRYASDAHRQSGLLSKSIGVKVTIPDSSYNKNHHGKPAAAVIGVKRRAGRFMRANKRGNLKGHGKAQRALTDERKRLAKDGKLSPLRREAAAVQAVAKQFTDGQYRNPSRYAHLAGKGRKGADVLNRAVRATKDAVLSKIAKKLGDGIEQEARSLVAG